VTINIHPEKIDKKIYKPQPHFEPSGVRVSYFEKGIILIVFNSQHSETFLGGHT